MKFPRSSVLLLTVAFLTAFSGLVMSQTPLVTIRATDAFAVEKSTATTASDTASFAVSRAGSAVGDLVVNLTAGGNAVLATDFTVSPAGATTSVTIPAGKESVVITVTPVDNATQQDERPLALTVAAGAGYTVGSDSSATVFIADMDKAGSTTFTGDSDALYSYKVYSVSYYGGTSKISIPTYRGVELPVVRVLAHAVAPGWMARWAYDKGVAFVSTFIDTYNQLGYIPVLATASGHPEVNNAMFITIGASAGATWAVQTADAYPDRAVFAMGITGGSARYAPSLMTWVEFEDTYGYYKGEGFNVTPPFSALITEQRARHTQSYDIGEQKMFFFGKFIDLRTDYQPGVAERDPLLGQMVARPLDYASGYIGEDRYKGVFFNYDTWEALTFPVADYKEEGETWLSSTSWLPDAASAAVWRAFTNRGDAQTLALFPQLGVKDDYLSNSSMACTVNTAQSQPCIVDSGLFADADVCEFYDNEIKVGEDRSARIDADGYRVFEHNYTWDDSRLGTRILHAVLMNSETGKRVQVAPPRAVYAVPSTNGHNTAPMVSPVNAMEVNVPATLTTVTIPFTISDAESSADSLLVKFGKPDEAQLNYYGTDISAAITGSGASRTLTLTLDPAKINHGGTVGGIIMVSDGELSSNAYVSVKINMPGSAPFFQSMQSIGSGSHENSPGYIDEGAGNDMSKCVVMNGWSKEWSLTVRDWDTDPRKLTLSAVTNTPASLPQENIIISGYGNYRTIQVRPTAYTPSSQLTLYLSDGTNQVTRTYVFTIVQDQDMRTGSDDYKDHAPVIGCIPNQRLHPGEQSPRVYFEVADFHTLSEDIGGRPRLKVAAFSDNQSVLPNNSIVIGDPGRHRWVSIKPPAASSGTANVRVVVTDEAGFTAETSFAVTVESSRPYFESDSAASSEVVSGATPTFSVSAQGGGLTYQWYRGASGDTSQPIAGATSATYTPAGLTADASFWCRVTNAHGSADGATQTVRVVTTAPLITTQPQDKTANAGDTLYFTVAASGERPSYQWYRGESGNTSSPVSGATASILSTTAADGDSYWVRVSNLAGSADSAAATVTTADWIAYHDSLTSAQINDGNSPNVSEGSVSGTAYALKNFSSNATLGNTTITFTDNGSRTALTTGANPSSGTDAYALFNGKIAVGAKSEKMTSPSTSVIKFSGLRADRTYALAFYATRNQFTNQTKFALQNTSGAVPSSSAGVTIGGAGNTEATVDVGAGTPAAGRVVRWDAITPTGDGGTSFSVLVGKGNVNDFVLPQGIMLRETIVGTPLLVSVPESLTVAPGGQAEIGILADGAGLTYQWYRGAPGDTSSLIAWNPASGTYSTEVLSSSESYWVRVTGGGTSVDSPTIPVTVSTSLLAPTITTHPASLTVEELAATTLSVSASGSGLTYQWRKDGNPLDGATGSTLSISSAGFSDAGLYDCVVGNAHGSTTSRAARVAVTPGRPPVIMVQPYGGRIYLITEGKKALPNQVTNSLFCQASGTGPISYQWRKDGVEIPGATDEYLWDKDAFYSRKWYFSDSGIYDCVVSNAFGSVISDPANARVTLDPSLHTAATVHPLTVMAAIDVTTSTFPVLRVLEGGNATLSVAVRGGAGSLVLRKKSNFTTQPLTSSLATMTTATDPDTVYIFKYELTDLHAADAEQVYEFYQDVDSSYNLSTFKLDYVGAPEAVTGIEDSYQIYINGDSYLCFVAQKIAPGESFYGAAVPLSGTAPYSFQWYKDNVAVPGPAGTEQVLVINNAQFSDSGKYHVVVTNAAGSYTSPQKEWTVSPDYFRFTTQPATQTVMPGSDLTLSVATAGAEVTGYQWYRNGVAIEGATAASFTITGISIFNEGLYSCVAERVVDQWDDFAQEFLPTTLCSRTSDMAAISVHVPTFITGHPQSRTAAHGQDVAFSVNVIGEIPDSAVPEQFLYQWSKGGVPVAGGYASTLDLSDVTDADAGSYSCVVTSVQSGLSATSNAALLTVLPPPPLLTTQPESSTINAGSSTTLDIGATGDSLSYQWFAGIYGDMSNPVGTGSSFTTPTLNSAASYWVIVSNPGGVIGSSPVTISVIQPTPPTITSPPAPALVPVGGSVTLNVAAAGSFPFSYQWKKDGVAISGATAQSLSINSATLGDMGNYSCVVTNGFGSATSLSAAVVVSGAPIITTQPGSQSGQQGNPAVLSVVATGDSLSYQWYQGTSGITTTPVPEATSATLTTDPLNATTSYWCRVSNANGSADSNTATVRLPLWEAYHDTVELLDNGATNATQNSAALTSAPTATVPVLTTLKNFATGEDMTGVQLSQLRGGQVPSIASNNNGTVAPAAGTDADRLFNGKIVVGQKSYQIYKSGPYTFNFTGLDPAKRYSVAFFASRDDSRYIVDDRMTLQGATSWVNASSPGTAAVAGSNDASVDVQVCQGSAANGRLIRWDDIVITGSSFSVKVESGVNGNSYIVPQAVAIMEYLPAASVTSPAITTQPANTVIASGTSANLSITASGTGLTYQWYQGMTGDVSMPVAGATSSSFTTPALTATTNYWVRVSNVGGSQNSLPATVAIQTPPATGFASYLSIHGLIGSPADPGADPDGDGVPNLLEFAFGDSPVNPAESRRPHLDMPDPATLDLTFHRARQDVRYVVESSTTLAPDSWTTEYTFEKNTDPASVGQDVMIEVPLSGSTRKFLRLRVVE